MQTRTRNRRRAHEHRHTRSFGRAAAAGLVALVMACGSTPDAPHSDAAITERVELALEQDGFTEEHEVRVRTEDGVVHLHGQVTTRNEADHAVALARDVAGVRSVENDLTVVPDDPDRHPVLDGIQRVP